MPVPTPDSRDLPRTAHPSRTRGFVLAAAVAAGLALPSAAAADVVQAPAASTFRDSVGVELHTGFAGYAYDTDKPVTLAVRLRYLGIDHVREAVCIDATAACDRARTRIGQIVDAIGPNGMGDKGLKLNYQVTPEIHAVPARADRDAAIERAFDLLVTPPLAGTVDSIEENNEPDLEKVTTWPQTVIGDDATIRRLLTLPKYAALASVPLLTPALGRPTATQTLLAAGWNTGVGEVPNFHPYGPAWGGPENGPLVPCATGVFAIDCVKKLSTTGGAPIATESGYSTAGYTFTGQGWVSERAQGIYEPRILLENFSLGIRRTYLYELMDLKPDYSSVTNGWGLYRSKYIDTALHLRGAGPKPAATALANLQDRIGDEDAAAAPGSLDLTLTGATGAVLPQTAIHKLLLRREDGSYALALWQPKAVFDNTMWKQHDVSVADVPVTVTLNSSVDGGWQATTFRPSVDYSATAASGSRFTVPVGADVTLIDLRGAGQGQIPGGSIKYR